MALSVGKPEHGPSELLDAGVSCSAGGPQTLPFPREYLMRLPGDLQPLALSCSHEPCPSSALSAILSIPLYPAVELRMGRGHGRLKESRGHRSTSLRKRLLEGMALQVPSLRSEELGTEGWP